ncbi:hypothetical protein DPMN_011435 [Dreissena polymorpha]|uniref:Uncharacterized protein n=1 Tax=Dreissena polymorpha TaxID=45954 RepID=A0A9D4N0J8_DREPO|nr:hypothetical protein DPMN_011435 [Dreissena polymorpha]
MAISTAVSIRLSSSFPSVTLVCTPASTSVRTGADAEALCCFGGIFRLSFLSNHSLTADLIGCLDSGLK